MKIVNDDPWSAVSRPATEADWNAISHTDRRKPSQEKLDADAAEDREKYDPTKGMGWGEKALVNVGAGIDSAWQGAKQLVGGGPSDEELKEKRRIDQHLADQTTGGGLLQVAGEIAPTIPLGLGAGALATRVGGLARAMAASPTLAAMGGGATSGALMPVTSDESRMQNIGLGAAGGGVAPTALKLAMKGARGAGQVGQRFAAALPGTVGEKAAEAVAGRKTAGVVEKNLPKGGMPAQDVYTPHPHIGGPGPSAAVATQSPELAALERGSRTTGGEHWQDFDAATHTARWEALDQGLATADDVAKTLLRANEIGADVASVYGKAGKVRFNDAMTDFHANLQTAKQSAAYHGNPAVKAAVDYVENTMAQAGQVTPELLHTMRRTVAKGLVGVPGAGEAGVRAASSEPFVLGLAKAMDDVLDTATRGKFGKWKGDYAETMTKAEGQKADVNIRSRFIDPATGTPRKPVAGLDGVPVLTPHALKEAIAAAGSAKRGPRKGQNLLSTGSEDLVQGVRRDLDAGALLQRSKAASTGGSGSDTASNAAQALAMEMLMPSGVGVARFVAGQGTQKADKAMQRQLAELLQDPAKLRAFIARQEQQRLLRARPPSLPGVGAAAGAPLLIGGG